MAGLYAIARQLFSREVGMAAALLYSICTARPDWVNLALNGELMMNLPIVWGLFLALRPSASANPPRAGRERRAAGECLPDQAARRDRRGTGGPLPPAALVSQPEHDLRRHHAVAQAGVLTASYFLTLGAAVLILYRQGILADAWYWTFGDHDVPHGPTDPVFW